MGTTPDGEPISEFYFIDHIDLIEDSHNCLNCGHIVADSGGSRCYCDKFNAYPLVPLGDYTCASWSAEE
jgi:hypothetical protein